VHLLEDFVGERLRDLEERSVTACLADALELGLGLGMVLVVRMLERLRL
jgi:hypothetical protein